MKFLGVFAVSLALAMLFRSFLGLGWWAVMLLVLGGGRIIGSVLLKMGNVEPGAGWGRTPIGAFLYGAGCGVWGLGAPEVSGSYTLVFLIVGTISMTAGLVMERRVRRSHPTA